jgi:hypothetical protein
MMMDAAGTTKTPPTPPRRLNERADETRCDVARATERRREAPRRTSEAVLVHEVRDIRSEELPGLHARGGAQLVPHPRGPAPSAVASSLRSSERTTTTRRGAKLLSSSSDPTLCEPESTLASARVMHWPPRSWSQASVYVLSLGFAYAALTQAREFARAETPPRAR